jgi:Holliday junction resolvase
MTESKLQSEIIKFLRKKGCYVIKTKPGAGVPMGCPDIIFMLEGFWGGIEVKATAKSIFQPLQKETIHKMNTWSYARVTHTGNWEEVRSELEAIL